MIVDALTRRSRPGIEAYGLTEAEVDAMREAQGGLCLICQRPERDLVVDHCHATGHVRGLLCNSCNLALGFAKDDVDLLSRARDYLIDDL